MLFRVVAIAVEGGGVIQSEDGVDRPPRGYDRKQTESDVQSGRATIRPCRPEKGRRRRRAVAGRDDDEAKIKVLATSCFLTCCRICVCGGVSIANQARPRREGESIPGGDVWVDNRTRAQSLTRPQRRRGARQRADNARSFEKCPAIFALLIGELNRQADAGCKPSRGEGNSSRTAEPRAAK